MVWHSNTYGLVDFNFINHILSKHSKLILKRELIMKVFMSYLLVFLLGWACAVWSYSDSIYTKGETSTDKSISQERVSKENK